jgi:phenylpropionate dioxygenase-like ring-hydroxylating dioxygenase large terminal subunit
MSIDRAAYSDPFVFDAEMARLFAGRMYIGSSFDLQATNDYRSVLFGNRAITVRHTSDGIRAFNNVCLHRNALIDPLGSGNRTFRCNYHGWSYGDDGALKSAPLADETTICNRRLSGYPISESNGLYFLGQSERPEVSDIALAFDETKTVLAEPFSRGVLDHACNWKLMVENVLEGYHLSYVHKDTFVQAGFTSTANYRYGTRGGVSWSTMTPKSGDGRDKSSKYQRISPEASHHYNHAFVFPNLFLANSNGLIGFLSSLYPINAGHTRLEWALFELPALTCLAPSIREHFRNDAIAFANATLLEDKALVESCHLGISSAGTACQFQPNEGRIGHFHSMYSARMSVTLG